MTKKQYDEGIVVNAMIAARMTAIATESFKRAYRVWEKSGKSKDVYPTPDLASALSGVGAVLFTPYQELVSSANALYSARSFFLTLPKEIVENDEIKRVIGDGLSTEGKRLDDLLKSKDLVFSII